MNYDVLRTCPAHVRDEWENLLGHSGDVARGLGLAVALLLDGGVVAIDRLPGSPPPPDAEQHEWVAYFVGQGHAAVSS